MVEKHGGLSKLGPIAQVQETLGLVDYDCPSSNEQRHTER
jgi:hypothetical protein